MSKAEFSTPLPEGAIQKKLVTDEDHENEKKIADEQKQKEMEEKNKNEKNKDARSRKKKKELRRIKKVGNTRELDLYITNNRLNEASFRRRLGPISKKHYKK